MRFAWAYITLHDSLSLNFKCALHYYPAIAKDCQIWWMLANMAIRSQGKKLSKRQKYTQPKEKELPWWDSNSLHSTLCTLGEISTRQLSWYIGVQGSVIMGEIILYVISQNAFNLASRGSGVATNTQTESMIY